VPPGGEGIWPNACRFHRDSFRFCEEGRGNRPWRQA
jgi:hypothetical protein